MDLGARFDTMASGTAFTVFTGNSGKMELAKVPLLFRDDVLEWLRDDIIAVTSGKQSSLLIRGNAGTGKSAILDALHREMKGCVQCAMFKCTPGSKPSNLFDTITKAMFSRSERTPVCLMRGIISTIIDDHGSAFLLVDDIDKAKYTVAREISMLQENGVTVIATATTRPRSVLQWNDTTLLEPYSMEEMMSILSTVVKTCVSPGVIVDKFIIESCAASVKRNYNSNIAVAMYLLDEGLKNVEKMVINGNRDRPRLIVNDIEIAASKYEKLMKHVVLLMDPEKDFNELLALFVLFNTDAATLKQVKELLKKVIVAHFPGKKPPSESTVRNALQSLASRGLITSKRTSGGFSSGVKTWWNPVDEKASVARDLYSKIEKNWIKNLIKGIMP